MARSTFAQKYCEKLFPHATREFVAYLGLGRVYPFFAALNQVFEQHNIELPLSEQATTTP